MRSTEATEMLPGWMRTALFATAVMNISVAALFLPAARILRTTAGFPADAPPIYLLTVALFVALFGAGYFYTAISGHAERMFITLAAFGKLSFVLLLVASWLGGSLPLRAPLIGSADLLFSVLFFYWLFTSRRDA